MTGAKEMRQKIREHMDGLLGSDAVLAVPSAPGPAPIINMPQAALNDYRKSLVALTSIAGLAGLPQVRLHPPCAAVESQCHSTQRRCVALAQHLHPSECLARVVMLWNAEKPR